MTWAETGTIVASILAVAALMGVNFATMNGRFTEIHKRIDDLVGRMARLEVRMETLETRVAGLEVRMEIRFTQLEARIDKVLDLLQERIGRTS